MENTLVHSNFFVLKLEILFFFPKEEESMDLVGIGILSVIGFATDTGML